MGLFDWTYTDSLIDSSGMGGQIATDGTYIWMCVRNSGATWKRLYRFRHSDKKFIKPNGTIGDPAVDAYVSLTAYADDCCVVTDGTYVLIGNTWETKVYRCSDMSFVTQIGTNGNGFSSWCHTACYDGTYFWTTGQNPYYLNRITPGTWAVTSYNPSNQMSSGVITDGTDLWLIGGPYQGLLRKVSKTGTSLLTVVNSGAGEQSWTATYDPVRGEVWFTGGSFESCRVRASDGAFINAAGSVVATFALAKINATTLPNDSWITSTGGCIVADGHFYVGGSGTGVGSYKSMQRRNTTNGYGAGLWYQNLLQCISSFITVNTTIYASFGVQGGAWGWTGLFYTDFTTPSPTLLEANPSGNGLNVVFDSTISLGSPTYGAPTTLLAVTGSSTNSSSSLHLVVEPVAPELTTAAANGTGIDLVFDKPVDIAAVPSYGGIANNLQVTLAAPVSGTEIQLTANAIAPKITTAKANVDGVDLVFDRPVSLGTTPDYGTTVGNLKINTAAALSSTETQLYATVTGNTYEWLSAPIAVTGVGVLPYVVTAWAESNTTFVLIFSEAVVESSAVNIANYAIAPALDIISIEKVDSTTYRMHTSQQTGNTNYSVTLTGVIDPANNPI